jgi:TetR/AcrR family transcriptional regulator
MVNQEKDQNTEQKILAAAREVFIEKGMDGARMQDIADRAGMNKALLHYYFRNKEKLFEMVFMEQASQFLPRVGTIMMSDSPLFTKIEQFVEIYIDKLTENPFMPLFILNELNRQPESFILKIWGEKRPPVQMFAMQIVEEVKKGNINPIEPPQLIVNMVSMCIFPFVAKPMIKWVTQMDDEQFKQFIQKRKTEVARFIIDSLRKK